MLFFDTVRLHCDSYHETPSQVLCPEAKFVYTNTEPPLVDPQMSLIIQCKFPGMAFQIAIKGFFFPVFVTFNSFS